MGLRDRTLTCSAARSDGAGHQGAMGIAPDLMEGTRQSVSAMIDWIVADHGLTRQDAYMLCSPIGWRGPPGREGDRARLDGRYAPVRVGDDRLDRGRSWAYETGRLHALQPDRMARPTRARGGSRPT